ncbi:MAG: acylphosphatase [Brevinematales bacterium]
MPLKKITAVISGRVQGVGFRYYIMQKAEMIGVKGWVMNTSAGDVKTVAEGEESQINDFLLYIGKGPSGARIENIEYKIENTGVSEFSGFDIRGW